MPENSNKPSVLVPVDVSTDDQPDPQLLELLGPARVVLGGWYPVPDQTPPEQLQEAHEEEAIERIDAIAAEFQDADTAVETVAVFTRDRSTTIDRLADEYDCGVVLVPRAVQRVERILVPIRADVNLSAILSVVGVLLEDSEATVTLLHAAVAELVDGIQALEHDRSIETIVVTRGGGADATLWCFNEEPVIRAISDCTTPVVVAVGHEDDETLAEQVADKRAMTPTAAGVLATSEIDTLREDLDAVERRIGDAYTAIAEQRLTTLADRIAAGVTALEQQAVTREASRQRVVDLERRLATAYETLIRTRLMDLDRRIDEAVGAIERTTVTEQASATAARGRVDDLEARIEQAYIRTTTDRLQSLEQRIDTAYREIEADEKIRAGQAEARRLRIVVAALVVLLVLVVGTVVLILL